MMFHNILVILRPLILVILKIRFTRSDYTGHFSSPTWRSTGRKPTLS